MGSGLCPQEKGVNRQVASQPQRMWKSTHVSRSRVSASLGSAIGPSAPELSGVFLMRVGRNWAWCLYLGLYVCARDRCMRRLRCDDRDVLVLRLLGLISSNLS
jgi:hypothetical protein